MKLPACLIAPYTSNPSKTGRFQSFGVYVATRQAGGKGRNDE